MADYVRKPPNTLCEGWSCVALNSPDFFRLLPARVRADKGRTTFGPSGAWWLRDRVEGVVDILTGHRLVAAEPRGAGVRLKLDGPRASAIDAEHVIAGTGFRVDTARLPFLSEKIQAGLAKRGDCPVVSRVGESTVPGTVLRRGAHYDQPRARGPVHRRHPPHVGPPRPLARPPHGQGPGGRRARGPAGAGRHHQPLSADAPGALSRRRLVRLSGGFRPGVRSAPERGASCGRGG